MENEQPAQDQGSKNFCCGHGGKKYRHHGGGGGCMGGLWFIGWLFTIGFLQLSFWKGVLALLVWPYFIGVFVNGLMR